MNYDDTDNDKYDVNDNDNGNNDTLNYYQQVILDLYHDMETLTSVELTSDYYIH